MIGSLSNPKIEDQVHEVAAIGMGHVVDDTQGKRDAITRPNPAPPGSVRAGCDAMGPATGC